MGRKGALTDVERGQIEALHSQGLSTRAIAGEIGRSQSLVQHCLDRGTDNPPGVSTARKRKLSERDERNIVRHASNVPTSAAEIKAELNLDASNTTVWRTLQSSDHLVHKKMLKKPKLTEAHEDGRRAFAHQHLQWTNEWHRVIFSDEKKFNLDGPDGWRYYWHDIRKEELIFSKRQHGGGSVMIWLAFSYDRKSPAVVVEGNLNAKTYKTSLQSYMLPMRTQINRLYEDGAIFQHDNAPAHRSEGITDWLEAKQVAFFTGPPKSSDLNPMENLFGLLARRVYADNRQYDSVADLTTSIRQCWAAMTQNELRPFIDSMPERMEAVIASHGKTTHF
jgi:transposase